MAPQTNIEVCTGATAYDDNEGNTKILVINEALWMGNQMSHSLINPYQIQAIGISLNNDLMAYDQYFDITHDLINIPFKMWSSRTPTQWELDNCEHIELTSNTEWDPNGVIFGPEVKCQADDDPMQRLQVYDMRHRKPNIDLVTLSKQWGIGIETAKNTLKCTTQAGI